jgi:hypothetical protein
MADAPEANASSPKRPSADCGPSRFWRRCDRLTAPCVIDGPVNGVSFRAYVEQVRVLAPGDIVIMDNLADSEIPRTSKTLNVLRPIPIRSRVK